MDICNYYPDSHDITIIMMSKITDNMIVAGKNIMIITIIKILPNPSFGHA